MGKNQLHQLLAVEPDLRAKAAKILNETNATFRTKADHFDGHIREFLPYVEPENEIMREQPQVKEVVTTVGAKLDHTAKQIAAAIDAHLSKEVTNSGGEAQSTVKIGTIEYTLSATALLALEGQLTKIRALFDGIPTLDPTHSWSTDDNDQYKSTPRDSFRTEKVVEPIVKYDATPEHPAQTELVSMDKNVGIVRTTFTSGRVTPTRKSEMLERIDALIVDVKRARAHANQAEVVQVKIGRVVFDYIRGK